MIIHGVKYLHNRPLFMKWGKHRCPVCNDLLTKVKIDKIVNTKSVKMKNYDPSLCDTYLYGKVKLVWTELHCGKCNRNYTYDRIYRFEKGQK